MIDRYVLKGHDTSFQVTFFREFFDEKFSFVMFHKLAKFHCQTVHFRVLITSLKTTENLPQQRFNSFLRFQ